MGTRGDIAAVLAEEKGCISSSIEEEDCLFSSHKTVSDLLLKDLREDWKGSAVTLLSSHIHDLDWWKGTIVNPVREGEEVEFPPAGFIVGVERGCGTSEDRDPFLEICPHDCHIPSVIKGGMFSLLV